MLSAAWTSEKCNLLKENLRVKNFNRCCVLKMSFLLLHITEKRSLGERKIMQEWQKLRLKAKNCAGKNVKVVDD
jgi:hypothetical protein